MTQISEEKYNELENHFDANNAWQCKHCGNLVMADVDQMIDHLDECEKFEGEFEA